VDGRPTQLIKVEHLSRTWLDLLTNHRKTLGRVYVTSKKEVEDAPNVVTGTFSLQTQQIDILFDSGATHSFIFAKLVETLGLVPTCTPLYYL